MHHLDQYPKFKTILERKHIILIDYDSKYQKPSMTLSAINLRP